VPGNGSELGRNPRRLAAAAFLAAYFLYFSWGRLAVPFSTDDLMNLAFYWKKGLAWMVYAQLPLWRGYYRPMGAVFYLPLFEAFGLNPAVYHATLMLVLLANAFLLYRFARLLGAGELAAGLAAFVVCYHAGLSALYYYTGFVYDVLCFLFYLGALVFYAGIRRRGRLLNARETAAFLGLFLCALNSKEMAVTLPAVLLVYEWIYHPPAIGRRRDILAWLRGAGRVALCGAAMDLPYLYGKAFGPDPLLDASGYHVLFSLHQVRLFQGAALGDLLLNQHYSGWVSILAMWALLLFLAWRRDRPVLRFCWWFVLIAPLPVEFLEHRTGANLYVPLAGMAVFGAVVFVDLARALAGVLGREAMLRRVDRRVLLAVVVAAGMYGWAERNRYLQEWLVRPAMARTGRLQAGIVRQFRVLHPHVAPGSQVAILNDPVEPGDPLNGLETSFIAELWFRDRSVVVRLPRLNPLTPEELARMDHVFAFEQGKLVQVK
jgi:hypothetical protein